MKKVVTVEGMMCQGCGNTVKTKFENLPGVQQVSIDLDKKSAVVETERELSAEELNQSLEETNYEVQGIADA